MEGRELSRLLQERMRVVMETTGDSRQGMMGKLTHLVYDHSIDQRAGT